MNKKWREGGADVHNVEEIRIEGVVDLWEGCMESRGGVW